MIIHFKEAYALPVEDVFAYFRTPADWCRLFPFGGEAESRGEGWYAVPLRGFPFPLVARNTELQENQIARWEFSGFWRGRGEVRFSSSATGVAVEGFEEISIGWLGVFSVPLEKLFLERGFRRVWEVGWRRLHKIEKQSV